MSSPAVAPAAAPAANSGAVVIAPLLPSCLLINGEPAEEPRVATSQQLDQIRQHASSEPEHGATARDQLVALLLECTPLAADVIDIVASYRLYCRPPLWVSAKVGANHHDSRPFDFFAGSDVLDRVLYQGYCVRQVIGWGSQYCNGLQFVYGPPASQDSFLFPSDVDLSMVAGFITSLDKHGNHHHATRTLTHLLEDEYISSALFRCGAWADSLTLTTNTGRTIPIGTGQGGTPYEFHAPEGAALIGFTGTVGGHVHGLSGVFASFSRHKPLTPAELAGREESESDSEGEGDDKGGNNSDSVSSLGQPTQEDIDIANRRLDSCCSDA